MPEMQGGQVNYQERAEIDAAQEAQWAWEDDHYMRQGYISPPLNTRPPGVPCGLPDCENHWPFQGLDDYDRMRAAGWRLIPYGSLRNYVDLETNRTVKDYPRHWVCPECIQEGDDA